jgi:hypothetical protein
MMNPKCQDHHITDNEAGIAPVDLQRTSGAAFWERRCPILGANLKALTRAVGLRFRWRMGASTVLGVTAGVRRESLLPVLPLLYLHGLSGPLAYGPAPCATTPRSPRAPARGQRPGHGVQAHRVSTTPLARRERPHLVALVRAGATFTGGKLAEQPDDQSQPHGPEK